MCLEIMWTCNLCKNIQSHKILTGEIICRNKTIGLEYRCLILKFQMILSDAIIYILDLDLHKMTAEILPVRLQYWFVE